MNDGEIYDGEMSDISNLFKDASLQNLSWLVDAVTFDPEGHDKTNDSKEDLELQLGYGDIDPDVSEYEAADQDRYASDDVDGVIKFARSLMLQGKMGRDLITAIGGKFSHDVVEKSVARLKELLKYEGIIGCIAIDASGYNSCKEAAEEVANSPNKKFMRYVMNCSCGEVHIAKSGGSLLEEEILEATENATDEFLSESITHKVELKPHCKTTLRPILSGMEDLDESDMDQTLIHLMTVEGLTPEQIKKIKKNKKSSTEKIGMAFRQAYRNKTVDVVAEFVDASEYQIESDFIVETIDPSKEDMDVDITVDITADLAEVISESTHQSPEFEGVDSLEHPMQSLIEMEDVASTNLDIDIKQDFSF